MALTVVLSSGVDADLLVTRNLVLQSAGYAVVPAFSIKEAIDCFQEGDFDLVLLCQSIPTKGKDCLTSLIRASGSRVPVVSVSGIACQRDAFTDATVGSEPGALLWGIREVLINAATPAVWTPVPRHKKSGALPLNEVVVAHGTKPPKSDTGVERQARTIKERTVPLGRAG